MDSAEIVVFYEEKDSQDTGDVSSNTLHCMSPTLLVVIQALTTYS